MPRQSKRNAQQRREALGKVVAPVRKVAVGAVKGYLKGTQKLADKIAPMANKLPKMAPRRSGRRRVK